MSAASQWSGALLVCGAVLLGVAIVAAALRPTVTAIVPTEVATLLVISAAFLTVSLPAMYAAQADVLPRGAAIVLLAATGGFFFSFFIAEYLPAAAGQISSAVFGILLAVSFAWIGITLWTLEVVLG